MNIFNSNAFHNLLNGVAIVVGAAGTIALATGCVDVDPDPVVQALDCSASFVPPSITAPVLVGIGLLKWVINITRDGLGGLLKSQPPVTTTLPVIPVVTTPDDAVVKVEYKTAGEKTSTKDTHVY